jgi:hypothetical protein
MVGIHGHDLLPHDPGGRSKPLWPSDSIVTATFGGPNECYRYELAEVWNPALPTVMFLMTNPSVACLDNSDNTLRKTGKFARSWGYGGQFVGNMHAYRATDPKRLLEASDPVGPDNDAAIMRMAARAEVVVLAYGKPPSKLRSRADVVVGNLREAGVRLGCLRVGKDGVPWHPLYLPDATRWVEMAP